MAVDDATERTRKNADCLIIVYIGQRGMLDVFGIAIKNI
jgi:hypothetical protein